MGKVYNFEEDVNKEIERIQTKEQILGKTLMQPFTANNSGSRKTMFCIQIEHSLPLLKQRYHIYRLVMKTDLVIIHRQLSNLIVIMK